MLLISHLLLSLLILHWQWIKYLKLNWTLPEVTSYKLFQRIFFKCVQKVDQIYLLGLQNIGFSLLPSYKFPLCEPRKIYPFTAPLGPVLRHCTSGWGSDSGCRSAWRIMHWCCAWSMVNWIMLIRSIWRQHEEGGPLCCDWDDHHVACPCPLPKPFPYFSDLQYC